MIDLTDREIIKLYFERSERAIEETDKAYGKYCRYISFEILRDLQDSEEIVNDVYNKVWFSIPPHNPESLKNYLAKIARRLSINRLEFNSAKKRGGGEYELVVEELNYIIKGDDNLDIESILVKDIINNFLRSLPDTKRRIFVRRYWYLSPIAEIAADFSISEGKVKMILMRLRNDLKKKLEMEGVTV